MKAELGLWNTFRAPALVWKYHRSGNSGGGISGGLYRFYGCFAYYAESPFRPGKNAKSTAEEPP